MTPFEELAQYIEAQLADAALQSGKATAWLPGREEEAFCDGQTIAYEDLLEHIRSKATKWKWHVTPAGVAAIKDIVDSADKALDAAPQDEYKIGYLRGAEAVLGQLELENVYTICTGLE